MSDRVSVVRATTIDAALGDALGTDDPAEIGEVAALLETLARRLTPDKLARLRAARPGGRGAGE